MKIRLNESQLKAVIVEAVRDALAERKYSSDPPYAGDEYDRMQWSMELRREEQAERNWKRKHGLLPSLDADGKLMQFLQSFGKTIVHLFCGYSRNERDEELLAHTYNMYNEIGLNQNNLSQQELFDAMDYNRYKITGKSLEMVYWMKDAMDLYKLFLEKSDGRININPEWPFDSYSATRKLNVNSVRRITLREAVNYLLNKYPNSLGNVLGNYFENNKEEEKAEVSESLDKIVCEAVQDAKEELYYRMIIEKYVKNDERVTGLEYLDESEIDSILASIKYTGDIKKDVEKAVQECEFENGRNYACRPIYDESDVVDAYCPYDDMTWDDM